MKTNELTEAALDWAVTQAQGLDYEIVDGTVVTGAKRYEANSANDYYGCEFDEVFAPSTDWAQGGPILERENIELGRTHTDWRAQRVDFPCGAYGPTPLIAAMRCYVASKLGADIDVPEELTK
jgi:hypothetical protein